VDVLRGRVATMQRRPRDAPPLLLSAARRLERFDRRAARRTYRDAFIAAIYAGRFAGDVGVLEVAAAARTTPSSADPPSAADELLDAAALLVDAGWEPGAARAQRALAAFCAAPITREVDLHWLLLVGRLLAPYLWDDAAWDTVSRRMLELVRDAGVLAL